MVEVSREGQERYRHLLRASWPIVLIFGAVAFTVGSIVFFELAQSRAASRQLFHTGHLRTTMTEIRDRAEELERLPPEQRVARVGELERPVQEAREQHDELLATLRGGELFHGAGSRELRRVAKFLETDMEKTESAVQASLAGMVAPSAAELEAISARARRYLFALNHLDLRLATSTRASLKRMLVLEGLGVVLSGVLLIVISLWLLRPSLRLIGKQVDALTRANRSLTTSRALLADALISAQKTGDFTRRLMRTATHDLRAPLQSVVLSANLAAERPEKTAEYLGRISRNATRMTRLIDELLTGQGADLAARHMDAIDPCAEVEALADTYRPVADSKNLRLTVRAELGAPRKVLANRLAFARCIENLLANAVKFTQAGSVTVRIAKEPGAADRFLVEVEDTGPGFSLEVLEREPVASGQGLSTTTNSIHGIGLWSTRRILAEELGGEMSIESELGYGSRFSMRLPVAGASRDPGAIWGADTFVARLCESGVFEGLRAAVIADHELVELLCKLAPDVERAESIEGLCAILEEAGRAGRPVHFVLLDGERIAAAGRGADRRLAECVGEATGVLVATNLMGLDFDRFPWAEGWLRRPAELIEIAEWLARAACRLRDRESPVRAGGEPSPARL